MSVEQSDEKAEERRMTKQVLIRIPPRVEAALQAEIERIGVRISMNQLCLSLIERGLGNSARPRRSVRKGVHAA